MDKLRIAGAFYKAKGFKVFFYRAIYRSFLGALFLPSIITAIKKFQTDNLDGLIDYCFSLGGGVIEPQQKKPEILELLRIVQQANPRVVLEIGTCSGGTLFMFTRVASKDATLISVDLPYGLLGGGYPGWKSTLFQSYKLPGQKLSLIQSDSHKEATLAMVKKILDGKEVDFLFIDGDHTYEGVKKDFEMYSKLVRKGGIVAFHDVASHPSALGSEVDKFWNEIKDRGYEYKEFIAADDDFSWGGIGVIEIK